jgi:hypothetical protein
MRRIAAAVLFTSVMLVAGPATPAQSGTLPASVDCPLAAVTATNTVPAISGLTLPAHAPSKLGLPAPTTTLAVQLKAAYLNAAKFLLTTWWTRCYGGQSGPIQLGGTDELHVRPPAAAALAIAVGLKTGAYDPLATGVPAGNATTIAKNLALGVAAHHKVNDSTGWTSGWQSSHWADFAGSAAWLLWADLTSNERQAVARMVAAEADFQVNKSSTTRVPYYADRNGHINFPGDTKAEENAWNAGVLSLAAAMMPTDTRAPRWRYLDAELLMSALARPADLNNSTIINGRPVSTWLNGTNVANDGTLINHNIIHPDYMAAIELNAHATWQNGLAGTAGPLAAKFGTDKVYAAFTDKTFASPPFRAPGGHLYISSSADVYFPQGTDWGTGRAANYVNVDLTAVACGYDRGHNAPAWAALHLQKVLREQARSTDGRSYLGHWYDAGSEDTYPGREQWVAANLAEAWLITYLGSNNLITFHNNSVVLS